MSAEAIAFYNTLLALFTIVALIAAVGLTVFRLVRGPEAAEVLGDAAVWMAWVVALVATVGSLIYSEVIHFVPCRLCWFQRIAMYPLAVILLVGAIRRDAAVRFYGLPLSIIGLGVSIWHYFVQLFPSIEGGACDPTNPCSLRYVEVFGFISIPFMAGAGFILVTVLLALYVRASRS